MKVFIKADILIWHLQGERKAINFLRKLVNGGQIQTLNKRHYPMKDVVVNKAR